MPKQDSIALLIQRKKIRAAHPAPAWGDHVLHGIEGRVTAGNLKRLTQSMSKAVK